MDFVGKMKAQKEKETVIAAMEKANVAYMPMQDISSPRNRQRVGTPGRFGSSRLTLRKKKVAAIV